MSTNFNHLELAFKANGVRRRKPNEFPQTPEQVKNNKRNRGSHSAYLSGRANSQLNLWSQSDAERIRNNLPELPTDKAMLIKIPPEEINLDFLRSTLKFEVVCEYEEGFVIVATDPDAFRDIAENKIKDFADEISGTGNIAKLYDIVVEETKDSRLKRILSEELYENWSLLKTKQEEIILVDVSIECLGTIILPKPRKRENYASDERFNRALQKWENLRNTAFEEWDELCRNRQVEIERFVSQYNGKVVDIFDYIDDSSNLDSFEMKLEIPIKCLIDFAENYPYVFEVALPEEFDIDSITSDNEAIGNIIFEIQDPDSNAPTVCVIDSGVQENHMYISKAIKNELSKSYLHDDSSVADEFRPNGHGTRVVGAILYPDGISSISGEYTLPCFIANARVLDNQNNMPNQLLPSKIINEIVQDYFHQHGIKIFNHSIASSGPCRKKYMSSWATSIDNLAHEHDLLFLQASGNIKKSNPAPSKLGIKEHLVAGRMYPDYLLEDSCRIANPAQSTQALTVGSICCGQFENDDLCSFGEIGAVSSFARCGYGMWKSIKPEVVEYGGDYIRSKHNNDHFIIKDDVCPELIRLSPEGPAFAKDDIGTSFATPKVTYIAAQIEKLFPQSSSLLYRALIVQSARWTSWANSLPEDQYINALRYMGYGLPDTNRATTNNDYRVTFVTSEEKTIRGGDVHVYRIKIPDEIKGLNAEIRIDVTLAFSAKPRRTRKDFKGYFSTWVDWETSKSEEKLEDFTNRIIESDDETEDSIGRQGNAYTWMIGKRDNWGKIKGVNRNKSATQKDWLIIPAYDLPDDFCIAVIGHNGWCNTREHYAKYALTVSFEAINNDVEIYVPFSVEIETETTIEQEIETEIEISEL